MLMAKRFKEMNGFKQRLGHESKLCSGSENIPSFIILFCCSFICNNYKGSSSWNTK